MSLGREALFKDSNLQWKHSSISGAHRAAMWQNPSELRVAGPVSGPPLVFIILPLRWGADRSPSHHVVPGSVLRRDLRWSSTVIRSYDWGKFFFLVFANFKKISHFLSFMCRLNRLTEMKKEHRGSDLFLVPTWGHSWWCTVHHLQAAVVVGPKS